MFYMKPYFNMQFHLTREYYIEGKYISIVYTAKYKKMRNQIDMYMLMDKYLFIECHSQSNITLRKEDLNVN